MSNNTELIRTLDKARAQARKAAANERAAKEAVLEAMRKANTNTLRGRGCSVTIEQHTRKSVDTEAVKAAGLYEKFARTTTYDTLAITDQAESKTA